MIFLLVCPINSPSYPSTSSLQGSPMLSQWRFFSSVPSPVTISFVNKNNLLLLTWTTQGCLSVPYNCLSAQIRIVTSSTFSHCVARSSDSTRISFLFQAFSHLIFLKVYQLLYWLCSPVIWASYSALNLTFLDANYAWILHIFYTNPLLDTVFHLHLCILSHFIRTAFSLNLADAILWLQASSSYPAHISLLSLSLNYYSISLSHFTCNFRNCLFKASLSHPSSPNHDGKVDSCLW